jgi:uncharacterized protein YebE (UPF0316 family)
MPDIKHLMDQAGPWLPLIIFCLRIVDVSIGTVRTICVVRGWRMLATGLGFCEVSVWLVAVSSAITRLDRPINIIAYAGGFAMGNNVGMWLETKLALGHQIVRLISVQFYHDIAERLRDLGYRVTEIEGQGRGGPVGVCFIAAPRRQVTEVIHNASQIDPNVFITVEDTRDPHLREYRNPLRGTGWRFGRKRK